MVCGPWPHAAPDEQKEHGVDSVGLAISWFDQHLKGRQPVEPELPRISCFVVGADEWEAHDSTSGTGSVTLRLTGDMHLLTDGSENALTSPDVPVDFSATAGIASGIGMYAAEASNLTADLALSKVWTFAKVAAPLDIYGQPTLRLARAMHPLGTDIAARLVDVAPNGTTVLITRGFVRRGSEDQGAPAAESSPATTLRVDMDPVRYRVHPCHSLMLALATADFPSTGRTDPVSPLVIRAKDHSSPA